MKAFNKPKLSGKHYKDATVELTEKGWEALWRNPDGEIVKREVLKRIIGIGFDEDGRPYIKTTTVDPSQVEVVEDENEEPKLDPAPEVDPAPAPVVEPEVDPAPVDENKEPEVDPAPVVEPEVDPAPVVEPEVDPAPAPVVEPEVDPAPVVEATVLDRDAAITALAELKIPRLTEKVLAKKDDDALKALMEEHADKLAQ